jgi:iron complex outermembrane recepter protein
MWRCGLIQARRRKIINHGGFMSYPVRSGVARAVALSIASSLLASSVVVAAEEQEDELAEVVVTAQFREQKLQDTPIAITAVNAEMLEQRGQTNIAQVAAQAPNVSLRPQPQNGGSGLIAFIRGVGQVDFNYAVDPGVGVYVDDVYIPTLSSSLLELMDLDRIEILRGPQGTLAGKNSIGGAIKLFGTKPKGDDSGSLRLSYGSLNELTARGMMDIAITDNLAMRASGMSRGRDGYVAMLDYGQTHPNSNVRQNNTRGAGNSDYSTMGGQNISAGRVALRFTPNDRLEINASADYTREKSEAIPTVLIAAGSTAGPFDPFSVGDSSTPTGDSSSTGRTPWLRGKNGQAVNVDCHFVPAGPYSCDTGGNLLGWDPRYVSYSNFLDGMDTTVQAPYKPYAALPITEFQGSGFHGNLTYEINDNMQLVYIGSYRKYESKFGQDQDATPIPVSQLDNQLNHHAFTSELRLNFEAGDGFMEGTVGAFYLKQKGTYTARVDLNYVSPVIDFLHGPDTTPSNTKAVFGTVTVHPSDALSLTGGLRYTEDEKDYTYYRSNPDGSLPNAGVCFANPPVSFGDSTNCLLAGIYGITGHFGGKDGETLDWRVTADYRFSPEFLTYASVSTGFKGGGVNPRPFTADQRLPFKPETLTAYEVGFKSDLFNRRMRLNGAAFLNKYDDIQLRKQACPESVLEVPCLRPDNIGSADVKGVELEATVYPGGGFLFDTSISFLDFEYTSAVDTNGLLVNTAIPANGITPYTPELTYAIGAQYDHDVAAGTLSFRVDGSYQGKVFDNAENTSWSKIPGRFLANAKITYSRDADWKVGLEVQNLFDKYYFQSVSDVSAGQLGVVTGVPGLPRTFALFIERKF